MTGQSFTEFQICQGLEYGKIVNMQDLQKVLNMSK